MKIEPSSDFRSAAQVIRQAHVALTDVGFSDEQAFELTTLVVGADLLKEK